MSIRSHGKLALASAALAAVFGASCARSNAYLKKTGDDEEGYYSRGPTHGSSKAGKLETLGQPKKRVVILNFWNDTPIPTKDAGAFAADELRRLLYQTERVIVPMDLDLRTETKDFVQGKDVQVAQLIREGRRLGVAVIVIGRIAKIAFRQRGEEVGLFRQKQAMAAADVEMKVFDVQAGREVIAAGRSGESSSNSFVAVESDALESREFRNEMARSAVREAVIQLAPDVIRAVEKMAWEGRVAKISGNKVYINSGRKSGLLSGDILRVMTPGEDVYDPASSAYLGRADGQLKGTLEVIDFIGEDAAMCSVHTGGNFQEGDGVRLY